MPICCSHVQEDLVTWQSVLKVTSVVTADYGDYVCVARNELNFQRQEIVLGGTTSPDPPIEVKALSVTHNSVHLSWTPGFDGGLIQVRWSTCICVLCADVTNHQSWLKCESFLLYI